MRTFLIILSLCFAALASHAGGQDSCTTSAAQPVHISLTPPLHKQTVTIGPIKYLPEHRIRRKLRIANGMLLASGALLAAAVPAFIIANVNNDDKTSQAGQRSIEPHVSSRLAPGILLTAAGIGLAIPSLVLRAKYKRQLANR